jgi:ribosome-binding protein aMBF1 (putative translation factor)
MCEFEKALSLLKYFKYYTTYKVRAKPLSTDCALTSHELSSELIRAARALLRWDQTDLASASEVSISTVKRLESQPGKLLANRVTVAALKRALEDAGVEFIDPNGGGPGVRLKERPKP